MEVMALHSLEVVGLRVVVVGLVVVGVVHDVVGIVAGAVKMPMEYRLNRDITYGT